MEPKGKDLKHQLFENPDLPKDRTLLQVMEAHTPPNEGRPVEYADKIAKALGGGITRDSQVKDFKPDQVEKMVQFIFGQEDSTKAPQPLPRDSPDLPLEIREPL